MTSQSFSVTIIFHSVMSSLRTASRCETLFSVPSHATWGCLTPSHQTSRWYAHSKLFVNVRPREDWIYYWCHTGLIPILTFPYWHTGLIPILVLFHTRWIYAGNFLCSKTHQGFIQGFFLRGKCWRMQHAYTRGFIDFIELEWQRSCYWHSNCKPVQPPLCQTFNTPWLTLSLTRYQLWTFLSSQVEMLPDIAHAPRILPKYTQHIQANLKKVHTLTCPQDSCTIMFILDQTRGGYSM